MESLWQDLRFATRMLARSPGFAVVAILTLALGIGANTAIFSVINATLLKAPPFPQPDRLALVWETHVKSPEDTFIVSAPNFWDWRQQNHVFESIGIFDSAGKGYNLAEGKEPVRVSGLRVSASFFTVLGVKPMLGRTFLPEEDTLGKDHEVVLSFPLWKRRYSANPGIVGQQVRIDGESYTVVGVMPPEFEFQFESSLRQLWVPIGYTEGDQGRGSHSFVAIARLKPGVTLAQARAEMDAIGRHLSSQYPQDNPNSSATATALADFDLKGLRKALLALLAAVGLVLLIACVNVANLMLARNATRQREFAIRRALGAGRARIMRQLFTESMLIALLGGVAGVIAAFYSNDLMQSILPDSVTLLAFRHTEAISLDARVFVFALLISCLTGIVFALAPAFSARSGDLIDPLKEGGRGRTEGGGSRLRQILVASEIALSLIVLVAAGLMIESMSRLLNVAPGFNAKNVLTAEISLPQIDTYYGPPVHERFCRDLAEHLGSLPGVSAVSSVSHLELEGSAGRGLTVEGKPDPGPENQPGAGYRVACPGYFGTMGIPLIAGRDFSNDDSVSAPGVIIVNQSMAKRFWPKESAVGHRIKIGRFDSKEPWVTVVGVYADLRHWGLDEEIQPEFFRPYTQAGWPFMTIVARTVTAPMSFENSMKKALAEIEPEEALSDFESMEDIVRDSTGSRRFPMLLLGAFAFLALALATVGIAGVASYSVAQRTHEIGIRMALGAQPGDVLKLMVGKNMRSALAGVALGIVGSIAATRLLIDLLYAVKPTDPIVLGAVVFLLTLVALLASYLPARRAAKLDPMVALRWE
jgi:putative ABC transport system permease protein